MLRRLKARRDVQQLSTGGGGLLAENRQVLQRVPVEARVRRTLGEGTPTGPVWRLSGPPASHGTPSSRGGPMELLASMEEEVQAGRTTLPGKAGGGGRAGAGGDREPPRRRQLSPTGTGRPWGKPGMWSAKHREFTDTHKPQEPKQAHLDHHPNGCLAATPAAHAAAIPAEALPNATDRVPPPDAKAALRMPRQGIAGRPNLVHGGGGPSADQAFDGAPPPRCLVLWPPFSGVIAT